MKISLELVPNSIIPTSAAALNQAVVDEHPALIRNSTAQSGGKVHCLWCGRAFQSRATGGSAQKFCSTAHRQAFWIAARRWTMRAIEGIHKPVVGSSLFDKPGADYGLNLND
jgi:hypothetical protein